MSGDARMVYRSDSGDDYRVLGPLAYRGKKNCRSVICTRMFGPDGSFDKDCIGWHCSYCDAPCSSQGHRCDAAEAVLGEARRQAGLDA